MCGIVGQVNLQSSSVDPDVFQRMRDTLHHRGPDGAGTEFFRGGTVALGHRRLSIIDLTNGGRQPFCNEDQSVWVTFNGEIYNYRSLRESLKEAGHIFKSHTDTEVLVHGYEAWGIAGLVERLKGMFAFAIWDADQNKIVLARDRFGIKPLYYYQNRDRFTFASEIKAITADPRTVRELDGNSVADYFLYAHIPPPNTIWKHVKKLKAAHFLELDADHPTEVKITKYWSLKAANRKITEKEAIERTHHLLNNATQEHLASDVPVGLLLSGGYDSSTLLMHMTDLGYSPDTFSVGFAQSERSEHVQAAQLSNLFGTNHHQLVINEDFDLGKTLESLANFYDEPFAFSSAIPYFVISELASQHVKVALAGDGGDEAFGGYAWHYFIHQHHQALSFKERAKILFNGKSNTYTKLYDDWMPGVRHELGKKSIVSHDVCSLAKKRGLWFFKEHFDKYLSPVKAYQTIDVNTFLEPNLTRADRSTMAHSLEARVPFLDHEIFEFTFSLCESNYLKHGTKKHLIFKNLCNKVPPEILSMQKRGFSFQNFKNACAKISRDTVPEGELAKHGIINTRGIENASTQMQFQLLTLEHWFRKHY